jgi:hypothetical protein
MSIHLKLNSAKNEIRSALDRHLQMLEDVRTHSITNNEEKKEFLYLMAVPVIYAAWEGYFRLSCSICLRRKCYRGKKSKCYESSYSTLWLQKETFVASFLQGLVASMQLGRVQKKIGNGQFNAISKFSSNLGNWREQPLDHLTDFDKLVMTHSNVNKEVTEINSKIIGLNLDLVNFSRIDELLNRRNEIAHGGIRNSIGEDDVKNLIDYTKELIAGFHGAVDTWLHSNSKQVVNEN